MGGKTRRGVVDDKAEGPSTQIRKVPVLDESNPSDDAVAQSSVPHCLGKVDRAAIQRVVLDNKVGVRRCKCSEILHHMVHERDIGRKIRMPEQLTVAVPLEAGEKIRPAHLGRCHGRHKEAPETKGQELADMAEPLFPRRDRV